MGTYGAYALPTATAQVSPSASLTTLGLADPSIPAVGGSYAGAGRYVANSAGVVHVAKRSADAEPEPEADAFYGTYGYGLPYTYGAYTGYAGYAGYPYTYGAYPYATYAAAPAVTVAAPAVTKVETVEAAPAVATVAAAPAVAAYAPYTYGAYALPTATAQVSPSASLTTLGLADPSIPAVGGAYAGAGRYV